MEEDILAGEARTLNDSLGYILAVIGSVLLSFGATALQRDGVCLALAGDSAGARAAQDRVRRLRLLAGAILIGALGYFLCLALRAAEESAGTPRRPPPGPTCGPPFWSCWRPSSGSWT